MTNAIAPIPIDLAAIRADAAASKILRDWRRLTGARNENPDSGEAGPTPGVEGAGGRGGRGGRGGLGGRGGRGGRTLVACSAGGDSTALLLALASRTDNIIGAYIRHDMRAREETDLDLAFVRGLASSLGIAFTTTDITLAPGNAEASARRARYAALTQLAEHHACPFVAVGHHADDLLETQIMALIRGTSPRGLASLRPRRRLSPRVTLIRPMLSITRREARAICQGAEVCPVEDRTNADTQRLRAALRQGVLGDLAPGAARRARKTAALMRDAHALISERARAVRAASGVWERSALAGEREIIITQALRDEFVRLTGGAGADSITNSAMAPIVRAIRDRSNERRVFTLASGVRIEVGGPEVRMTRGAEGSHRV